MTKAQSQKRHSPAQVDRKTGLLGPVWFLPPWGSWQRIIRTLSHGQEIIAKTAGSSLLSVQPYHCKFAWNINVTMLSLTTKLHSTGVLSRSLLLLHKKQHSHVATVC